MLLGTLFLLRRRAVAKVDAHRREAHETCGQADVVQLEADRQAAAAEERAARARRKVSPPNRNAGRPLNSGPPPKICGRVPRSSIPTTPSSKQ